MQIPHLSIALIIATFFSAPQGQSVNTTKVTRFQATKELKLIERSITFRPERDLGDEVRKCAELVISLSFRNDGGKPLRHIDFEIVLYGQKTKDLSGSRARISKRFSYDSLLGTAQTGSLRNELGGCDLFAPTRQTLRIVRIVYEDGSSLEP